LLLLRPFFSALFLAFFPFFFAGFSLSEAEASTERIYAHDNPDFLVEAKRALERRPEPKKPTNIGTVSKLTF